MRYLQTTHLIIYSGTILGVLAAAFLIDTDPAIFGWFFAIGAGVTGGAFVAALASGEQVVSGPKPRGGGGGPLDYLEEDFEAVDALDEPLEDNRPER